MSHNDSSGQRVGIGLVVALALVGLRVCSAVGRSSSSSSSRWETNRPVFEVQPFKDFEPLLPRPRTWGNGVVTGTEEALAALTSHVDYSDASLVVENVSKDQWVASARFVASCDKYGVVPVVEVARLPPGQHRRLNIPHFGTCGAFLSWRIEDALIFPRTAQGLALAAGRLAGLRDGREKDELVHLLCLDFRPEHGPALVQAASSGKALAPVSQGLVEYLVGVLPELADRDSELSIWANADRELVPLLERAATWPPERKARALARARTALGETTQRSESSLMLAARAHDAFAASQGEGKDAARVRAVSEILVALGGQPSQPVAEALLAFGQRADLDDVGDVDAALSRMPLFAVGAPAPDARRLFPRSGGWNVSRFTENARRHVDAELERALAERDAGHLDAAVAIVRRTHLFARQAEVPGLTGRTGVQLAALLVQQSLATDDLAVAEAALDEARRADPASQAALAARETLEVKLVERLLEPGFLYEGPSPAFHRFVAEGSRPTHLAAANGYELVSTMEGVGFRPLDGEGPAALERVLAARDSGLHLPPALQARAFAAGYGNRALAGLVGLLMVLLLFAAAAPERAGLFLAHRGLSRAAAALIRWRIRRFPTREQAFACLRGFVVLAERGAPRAFRDEARALADRSDGGPLAEVMLARLDFLSGDVELAQARYATLIGRSASLPKWLRQAMHLDLARAAFAEGWDDAAADHARDAGSRGALLAAAALLRAERPTTKGLWSRALWGRRRRTARVLLVHALIDLGRLTLARRLTGFLPAAERAYAHARWLHASGDVEGARAAYGELRAQRPEHRGARLGLATLSPEPHRGEDLTALAAGSGDAAQLAREALAAAELAQGRPDLAHARLGSDPQKCRTWREVELQGVALAALHRFDAAAVAFARSAGLRRDPAVRGWRTALAWRAAQAGDAQATRALLAGVTAGPAAEELAARAEWTLLLRRLHANPSEGLEAAAHETVGGAPKTPPARAGVSEAYCRMVTLVSQGRLREAHAYVRADDALATALRFALQEGDVDAGRARAAFASARAQWPSLSTPLALVEASFAIGRGLPDQARTALEGVKLAADVGDAAAVGQAALASLMGLEGGAGLVKVFELTRQQRWADAAAALDALPGQPCREVRELRLMLGAAAARSGLEQGEPARAQREVAAALDCPTGDGTHELDWAEALVQVELLVDPRRWVNEALDGPQLALEAIDPSNVHDAFVLHTALLVQDPSPDHLQAFLAAALALSKSAATFARYRLRALELCGERVGPAHRPFEMQARDQMVRLVVDVLVVVAEHADATLLLEVMSPWQGTDEGLLSDARERVGGHLCDELRAALRRAEKEAAGRPTPAEATQIFTDVDGAIRRQLARLRAVGAPEAILGDGVDAAAHCLDEMSIRFHNELNSHEAALKAVERALELERAEFVRERLMRNRNIMRR